jgi:ubiquinone/menaquinone biosynthesis C-methylase UbiE
VLALLFFYASIIGYNGVASMVSMHEDNKLLQAKYDITAWFYDILDYPWERQYRNWRPILLQDVRGEVLEAGVGSGRNLKYYAAKVNLIGIDLCLEMFRRAMKRGKAALCNIDLRQEDATIMRSIPSKFPALEIDEELVFEGQDIPIDELERAIRKRLA